MNVEDKIILGQSEYFSLIKKKNLLRICYSVCSRYKILSEFLIELTDRQIVIYLIKRKHKLLNYSRIYVSNI